MVIVDKSGIETHVDFESLRENVFDFVFGIRTKGEREGWTGVERPGKEDGCLETLKKRHDRVDASAAFFYRARRTDRRT